MVTLAQLDGLGLPDGTAVGVGTAGTGDTPITGVSGSARTIRLGDSQTPAVEFAQAASVADDVFWDLASGQPIVALRTYLLTPAAWPASSQVLASAFSTLTTNAFRVVMAGSGSPGSIRLSNAANANTIASANGVLSLATWYRVEALVNQTAGTARLVVSLGDTTTVVYDSGVVAGAFGAAVNRLRWGNFTTTPNITVRMAHYKATDSTTLIGPATPPVVASGRQWFRWTGAAQVPLSLSRATGSTPQPVKFN